MMFLDCPAYLDDEGAARCGLPAEVRCSYTMQSTDGPLDSAMIKCPSGHRFNGPLEFLTWKNGEGQDVRRSFDRGPGSDAMEPASTYTIMAEPEPDVSVAGLGKSGMPANDAIHLATADGIRTDLSAFVCYDKGLRDSAHALGLPVEAPA
jgi:hypothetical protein